MKKYTKRKGFTLIELLVTIVIIGILAARMLLSSREGAVSALASEILADFESIKTATAAYYIDNSRIIEKTGWSFPEDGTDATVFLKDYLTNTSAHQRKADGEKIQYSLAGQYNTNWFVWCPVYDKAVMQKLKIQKEIIGLYAPKGGGSNGYNYSTESKDLTADTGFVGMCIFKRK